MEKRPGDEVALASFDRSEYRGTEVRDQTEIAWYYPQFSMGNSFPDMSVTELSGSLRSCPLPIIPLCLQRSKKKNKKKRRLISG